DPSPAHTDLRGVRAATKRALIRSDEAPDERWTLLPLAPLVPERLGKRWVGVATNSAASVGSSNIGVVPGAIKRPDGTDADSFAMRSLTVGMTKANHAPARRDAVVALGKSPRASLRLGRRIPTGPQKFELPSAAAAFDGDERIFARRHDRLAL